MRALAAAVVVVLLLFGGGLIVLALMAPVETEVSVTVPVLPKTSPKAPHVPQPSAPPQKQSTNTPPPSNGANGAPPPTGPVNAPGLSVTGLNPAVKKLLDEPEKPQTAPAPGAAPENGKPAGKSDPPKMTPAPMSDVTEPSPFGPLERISDDGRRPLDVYARPSPYATKPKPGDPPRVAVLLEGLEAPDAAKREEVLALPPEISVAFKPYGDHLQQKVNAIRAAGHEVLLQVPLEPDGYPVTDPGPHTLLTTLTPDDNRNRLRWFMSRFTGYVGVTNYMGAKFEATETAFEPVLADLKARGLLYLDDGKVNASQTEKIARALSLAYAVADVQIAGPQTAHSIDAALDRLDLEAKKHGAAIAVADARKQTVKQLGLWASTLHKKGLVLVPVSAAVLSQV